MKKRTTKDFVSQMNTDDVREHSLMTSHRGGLFNFLKPIRKAWILGVLNSGFSMFFVQKAEKRKKKQEKRCPRNYYVTQLFV